MNVTPICQCPSASIWTLRELLSWRTVSRLGHGLDDRSYITGRSTGRDFFLHHLVHTGLGPPDILFDGYGEPFPWDKAAGAWSWPLTSNNEVKNSWSYTFTPPICHHCVVLNWVINVFMEWYYIPSREWETNECEILSSLSNPLFSHTLSSNVPGLEIFGGCDLVNQFKFTYCTVIPFF
jgi:hypothetical protein